MKTEYKKININKLYSDYKLLGEWLNGVKNGVKSKLSDFDSGEYLICWLHEYLADWEYDTYDWMGYSVHRWQFNSRKVECEVDYGEYNLYSWVRIKK